LIAAIIYFALTVIAKCHYFKTATKKAACAAFYFVQYNCSCAVDFFISLAKLFYKLKRFINRFLLTGLLYSFLTDGFIP